MINNLYKTFVDATRNVFFGTQRLKLTKEGRAFMKYCPWMMSLEVKSHKGQM